MAEAPVGKPGQTASGAIAALVKIHGVCWNRPETTSGPWIQPECPLTSPNDILSVAGTRAACSIGQIAMDRVRTTLLVCSALAMSPGGAAISADDTIFVNGFEGPHPLPGEMVITEIMVDPVAVSDPDGEWFELVNTNTEQSRSVEGCQVTNGDAASNTIGAFVVQPGDHVVFARTTDVSINGGVPADLPFNFSLTNSGQLTFECDGQILDAISWSTHMAAIRAHSGPIPPPSRKTTTTPSGAPRTNSTVQATSVRPHNRTNRVLHDRPGSTVSLGHHAKQHIARLRASGSVRSRSSSMMMIGAASGIRWATPCRERGVHCTHSPSRTTRRTLRCSTSLTQARSSPVPFVAPLSQ